MSPIIHLDEVTFPFFPFFLSMPAFFGRSEKVPFILAMTSESVLQ